ncbi:MULTISPECIES: response regulator transcription factor [Hahella]|uniref:Response regulator containing a CheY-like receiver domain and an HTH DNA-binding domain n=1 Tax=Hahella chejuensis (strain KCTC 2396) TaxID=349521 RepID=Q2SQ58_HAHCH|nr:MULTISPECIES: response regulator transcription factor [Hahella]ABC27216.1 Response regulator containing a CheY-like receiver domain and an HTH DNA-binding domain [Hahella chejuensis KCTC 2396]AZZ89907.1 response regulator transcription factor [Hahella sp. KA22]MBU6950459.1 response regulator transcription factor [Hahella sp. HN01]MDG9666205.1 response regulator transcription factor [Hahella sp. CR1]QAY53276.1 response regulator transcription factor [Hahella sp. KA22]
MNNRFVITDDHGIFRSGLKLIISGLYPDAEILEAASGSEVFRLLNANTDVDLVLLDLSMPDSQGLELLRKLKQEFVMTPFAVISASEEAALIQGAIQLGALGYVPKSSSNAVIASAIQLMLSGGVYIPHELLRTGHDEGMPTGDICLTPRQHEVLGLLAEGMSNKQIGTKLSIAPGTIKAHIAAIFRELNAANRTQAVHRARELKLL